MTRSPDDSPTAPPAAADEPAGGPPPAGSLAVVVNGAARELPAGSTAADLVAALGLAGRPLAVEHNEQVVPRSRLADCRLSSGDRLEIVTLVGGG
jgi:sulfur carrier protein